MRNPGALIEEYYRRRYLRTLFAKLGKGDVLLDLGCGPRPYQDLYETYYSRTIGADLADSPFPKAKIDLYCSATKVPLESGSLDTILCTEVLHDLAEPGDFFNECKRLLRPGGALVLTSPFVVPLVDGEYDHYRYTLHGLRYQIQKSGLHCESIQEVGDLFGVLTTLVIKPWLRIWNRLTKGTGIAYFSSAWNPLFTLTVLAPQYGYLLLSRLPFIRSFFAHFKYSPIGYVSLARKTDS